ncbi:hypothetical protein [Neoroseomonas soli]|uniref:Uncharacterized protein n=1 Tax=Neoroseomonas soli TaxID=1081025 RepID=A0A9X9WUV0_9PROT|nr:hypothetical protein [Neoroseomonas soli]MBR0670929.1 hypothetical protein [Neoroseomonas soli]
MTLALEPASARAALALFEATPTAREAERVAALTGSWTELLAHLLLRRSSLPPDIAAAIRAAAGTRGGAASPRPRGPDARRLRETDAALDAAMAALMQAEAAARAAADAATAALGAHAAERPVAGFDLHLRIASESA